MSRSIPMLQTVLVSFALGVAGVAAAHDPRDEAPAALAAHHAQSRVWVHESADLSFAGSYLASRDGRVSIQSDDGPVLTLEVARLSADDQAWVAQRERVIAAAQNPQPPAVPASGPWQVATFAPFAPFVATRFDDRWLYIESDGMPHPPLAFTPMVGIRAWQQQVPLPQPYRGSNAWQIPLKPELAEKPVSGRNDLMRGAVAIAANGIPIFNALNNRGDDTYAVGELDAFGGHSGRGDDYHYHIAPLAIEQVVGKGKPIAFALDGFPIYGLFDPDAKAGEALACPCGSHEKLDELNGHFCEVVNGRGLGGGTRDYHYHASAGFPYINGGLRGKVTLEGQGPESQVSPQPRAQVVREALPPLRGARITGFTETGPKAWKLEYDIEGKKGRVTYAVQPDGKVAFEFTATDGAATKDVYGPRQGGGGNDGGGAKRPREGRSRRNDQESPPPPPRSPRGREDRRAEPSTAGFVLSSSGLDAKGLLDKRFTCDGESISPPFLWAGAPAGTTTLALTMHHITPDDEEKVYLVVSSIPASVTTLEAGQTSIGIFGRNSLNCRREFAPPCSQGPGEKRYIATLYALSAEPALAKEGATREELVSAIKGITLGTTSLELRYARPSGRGEKREAPRAKRRSEDRDPPDEKHDAPPEPPGESRNEKGSLLARMTAFKTDVPERAFDAILVRPTATSIALSLGVAKAAEAVVEYWVENGTASNEPRQRAEPVHIAEAAIATIDLTGLRPSTEYAYRVGLRHEGEAGPTWSEAHRFRTQASPRTPFTFTIQADSHLDQGVTPAVYEQTLANMLGDRPDFVVDLGDTFMTDKRGRDYERSLPQYEAQRYYFGLACKAAPLFMVLGNHDGEKGNVRPGEEDMPTWSYRMRTARFPEPLVDVGPAGLYGPMYTGKTAFAEGRGANYYAFEWGDAQIVVLDPFWSTTERIRGGGSGGGGSEPGRGTGNGVPLAPIDASWTSTLGRAQYDWLVQTLASSKAAYSFVFIHHLVGGVGGAESRGGVESAPYFEWGGRNADGTMGFATERQGWPMPIHDLLVKQRVTAVFHGHDHLYVHAQKDGLHYQCVPQPGNILGNTRSAEEYGYRTGTLHGGPGYLRVRVSPERATIDFVRTVVARASAESPSRGRKGRGADAPAEANGQVVDTYDVAPRW